MGITQLLKDQDFLDLLDENDSKKMAKYLNSIDKWDAYEKLEQMFNDLGVFQDIALYNPKADKKYKYALRRSITPYYWNSTNNKTQVDLGDTYLYPAAVSVINSGGLNILVDSTTTIEPNGIRFDTNDKDSHIKLTFLGIPKFVRDHGIVLWPLLKSQVEIYTTPDLVDDVKKLFDDKYIDTTKPGLKNSIRTI